MELAGLFHFLFEQPLLLLAIVAIFIYVMGSSLARSVPRMGRFLRASGNLGLVAALLLTIAQVARMTTGADLALPQVGMPSQIVEGGETRIRMANDGHFWVEASVNGIQSEFLIDTGATITAISPSIAEAASVEQQALRKSVAMRTANGMVRADLGTISRLQFGNIVANDLDTVIAPGLGETNVIGMNLLSRLASWRVEDRTLILVPKSSI